MMIAPQVQGRMKKCHPCFRLFAEPVHVSLMSAGCEDPGFSKTCGVSSIKIDGLEVSPNVSHVSK